MSTRSQIGFYEKEPKTGKDLKKFEALLYRHSDGYPSGMLPEIIPFLKWWKSGRGLRDTEYVAARLLQWLCQEYDGAVTRIEKEIGRPAPYGNRDYTGTLGYGISRGFHGDIDWFYAVYPDAVKVYKVEYSEGLKVDPTLWVPMGTIDLTHDVDIDKVVAEIEK
jgi:hypothetical protein